MKSISCRKFTRQNLMTENRKSIPKQSKLWLGNLTTLLFLAFGKTVKARADVIQIFNILLLIIYLEFLLEHIPPWTRASVYLKQRRCSAGFPKQYDIIVVQRDNLLIVSGKSMDDHAVTGPFIHGIQYKTKQAEIMQAYKHTKLVVFCIHAALTDVMSH